MFKRTVKGLLRPIGENTGGQLAVAQVVVQAFTAQTFSGAGFITAVAAFQIGRFFTFHKNLLEK